MGVYLDISNLYEQNRRYLRKDFGCGFRIKKFSLVIERGKEFNKQTKNMYEKGGELIHDNNNNKKNTIK